jgi:hypothetical protein
LKPDSPCFTCKLPDCDDTSVKCALRNALQKLKRARATKTTLSDRLLKLGRMAEQEFHRHGVRAGKDEHA